MRKYQKIIFTTFRLSNLCITASTLSVFCTAAAAQLNDSTAEPIQSIGNQWAFQRIDKSDGGRRTAVRLEVVKIEGTQLTLKQQIDGSDTTSEIIYSTDMNFVSDGAGSNATPSNSAIQFPLKVGKSYDIRYTFASGSHKNEISGTCTPIELEKVKVTAGEFDTIRIECKLSQRALVSTFTAMTRVKIWYAPTVNIWVKKEQETRGNQGYWDSRTEELTKFELK